MEKPTPESLALEVVDACGGCQLCRGLLEERSCPFFDELFRLGDRETKTGVPASSPELSRLVELCNFCGMCPCGWTRISVREAKDAFIARDGLKPAIRLLEDVRRVSALCGAFPWLANRLLQHGPAAQLVKRSAGIHPERRLPEFPAETFVAWRERRGLNRRRHGGGRKAAYFAGCTAQYLFPGVARATVEVLERNGTEVYCPEQKCCGMPTLLEGDRQRTFAFGAFNVAELAATVEMGYDIVCSCPTCGYMLKNLFTEEIYVPGLAGYGDDVAVDEVASGAGAEGLDPRRQKLLRLANTAQLDDAGYFAPLDVHQRLAVASRTYDLGEYLRRLWRAGALNTHLGPVRSRTVYFPPCHTREQKMGEPWRELLRLVPELAVEATGDSHCCGMAGIVGFKRESHEASLATGRALMENIAALSPERIVSECLSCRLQFQQMLPYPVAHPVEVLREAYENYRPSASRPAEAAVQGTGRTGNM
jgi:glycerol-3-phosphate dehydrogenase subunit C